MKYDCFSTKVIDNLIYEDFWMFFCILGSEYFSLVS